MRLEPDSKQDLDPHIISESEHPSKTKLIHVRKLSRGQSFGWKAQCKSENSGLVSKFAVPIFESDQLNMVLFRSIVDGYCQLRLFVAYTVVASMYPHYFFLLGVLDLEGLPSVNKRVIGWR